MPIYEYEATDPANACDQCARGLEVLAKLSDPELTACPNCGHPVRRIISVASIAAGGAHLMQESHFSKRGFTQYKKAGGGVYEKTAGDGPAFISDDGK
jgi:putative FmdB family regulatory protein